jgi:hypothetical protein
MSRITATAAALICAVGGIALILAQAPAHVSTRHPAIGYLDSPTTDAVAALNRQISEGQISLRHDEPQGYLRSVLDALDVPIESQMLLFSETSLQSEFITHATPRALYFNDRVSVGWVQGSDAIEVAAFDPRQGMVFYVLSQRPAPTPHFSRSQQCLQCHESQTATQGVSGMLAMSMLPMSDDPNEYAVGWNVDQNTPIEDRWGGWFVTGTSVPTRHLGNVPVYHAEKGGVRATTAPRLASVEDVIDTEPYLSPYSDVTAMLVFNHQTQMTNLLTRLNWLTRVEEYDRQTGATAGNRRTLATDASPIERLAAELVDYMLFIDEAPLPGPVQGSSGFTERFGAVGPRDSQGRSLRDFALDGRTFRYPCSYMIYSEAFDALPDRARAAVYAQLSVVLAGQTTDPVYRRLTAADRQAIVEILQATKPGLPASFGAAPGQ